MRDRRPNPGLGAPVERLSDDDAASLHIELGSVTCTQLADLDTATDKARRDAPAIAVWELQRAGPQFRPAMRERTGGLGSRRSNDTNGV